jgi:CRP/FNR family cyclic AMP-dependent transcriptional regulator
MQLSSCYLFKGLSELQQERLIGISREAMFKKGRWLYRENEPGERIFILKKGAVELLTKIGETVELPITIARSPGDCFGSPALIPPYLYSLSARCVEDSTLLAIGRSDLQKLIQQDHELGRAVLSNIAEHFLGRLKETRQELKIHFKTLFKSIHQ